MGQMQGISGNLGCLRKEHQLLFLKWEQKSLQSKNPSSSSSLHVYFFFYFPSIGSWCHSGFIPSFLPCRLWAALWFCHAIYYSIIFLLPISVSFFFKDLLIYSQPLPTITPSFSFQRGRDTHRYQPALAHQASTGLNTSSPTKASQGSLVRR